MFELRDYQSECLEAITDSYGNGIHKQLIALPTGTGKTIIFSHLIKKINGNSLILAHRDELCQQAKEKYLMVDDEAEGKIGIVKAEKNEVNAPIVIGSVQTVSRPGRLEQMPDFDLIVTDEAHHAVAPTYQRIYEKLVKDNLHVGFTATPNRADKEGLGKVFDEVVYEKTIKEMIEAGWLCPLKGKRILTDISLDGVHTVAGDFNKSELTSVINTENRNKLIVDAWQKLASGRKTLAFTVDIQHAHDLAQAFQDKGKKAMPISGETPDDERQELEQKFHSGEIKVLCNCYLLTEGYDEPGIDCILLARPTKSQSLYIQMVGRGTRPLPGKKDCLILDVVDNTTRHDIRQFADLGLEPKGASEKTFATVESDEEQERFKTYGVGDELYAEEIDLLGKSARFDWNVLDSDTYKLYVGDGYIKVGLRSDRNGYYAYFKPFNGKKRKKDLQFITPKHKVSLSWAIGIAEDFASKHLNGNLTLISKQSKWKKKPATDNQINLLYQLGVEIPPDLTKGKASKMIDRIFHSQFVRKKKEAR